MYASELRPHLVGYALIQFELQYQDKRKPPTSMLPHMPLEWQQVKIVPQSTIVSRKKNTYYFLKNCPGARLPSGKGRRSFISSTQDTPVPTG